jgi:hypothetical protein
MRILAFEPMAVPDVGKRGSPVPLRLTTHSNHFGTVNELAERGSAIRRNAGVD